MRWPRQVAIVGAGYMGRGIAQVLAQAGERCVLADVTEERASAALDLLRGDVRRHERDQLVADGTAQAVHALVRSAASMEEAVGGSDLVIEAVFEEMDTKVQVLRRIEAAVTRDAVIATNTSAISITSLAGCLAHQDRFLGAHWFNPPQFVPGVELIACPETDPEVVDRVAALLVRAGKSPAQVGDQPGFVGNRLQYALFQEAAAIVEEGLASAETVDTIVRGTFGFRLPFFGPFAIADMAGLDVYRGAYRVLEDRYPGRFVAPAMLRDLIERGELGAKTGSGFVIRTRDEAHAMAARRDRAYAALLDLLAVEGSETDEKNAGPPEPRLPRNS